MVAGSHDLFVLLFEFCEEFLALLFRPRRPGAIDPVDVRYGCGPYFEKRGLDVLCLEPATPGFTRPFDGPF